MAVLVVLCTVGVFLIDILRSVKAVLAMTEHFLENDYNLWWWSLYFFSVDILFLSTTWLFLMYIPNYITN